MHINYFTKRETYPDLGKFLDENIDFSFDMDFFNEAMENKDSLTDELECFVKNYSTFTNDFHFNIKDTTNLDKFSFYKEFKSIDSISNLPFVTKSKIREDEQSFENNITQSMARWHFKTSGTSGVPLDIYYSTNFYLTHLYLTLVKTALRVGMINLGEREFFSVFLTDNDKYANSIFPYPENLLGPHLILNFSNDDHKIRDIINFLNATNPEIISSKPNVLNILMENSKRLNLELKFKPKLIVSSGAMLTLPLRLQLQDFFKTRVTSSYNITEIGHVGSECSHNFIHFDSSNLYVECLDETGSIAKAQHEGELVFSSVSNQAMPLLRYKTGDRGVISSELCGCGSAGLRVIELKGRSVVQFVTRDGKKISPTQWMHIFTHLPELENYQMTQKEFEHFEIKVEFNNYLMQLPEDHPELLSSFERIRSYFLKTFSSKVNIHLSRSIFDKQEKFSRFRCEVL